MKVAIVNHGAPGSGMTTMAIAIQASLKVNGISCKIHSTDDFFMEDGEYKFNHLHLSRFHNMNLGRFKQSIQNGVECVICDNTNLVRKHVKPYVDYAEENGYIVVEVYYHTDEVSAHIARCPIEIPRGSMKKYVDMADNGYRLNAFRLSVSPENYYTDLVKIPKLIKKLF